MTRKVLLDLGALSLGFVLAFAVAVIAGPVAMFVFVLGVVGIFLAAATLLAFAVMIAEALRPLDSIDERCSKVDSDLDQELAARRQLRVVNTVRAEPRATVIDIRSRKTVA